MKSDCIKRPCWKPFDLLSNYFFYFTPTIAQLTFVCIKDPDKITPHKVFWLVLCTLLSKLNVYFLLTGKKYLTPSKVRILRKFILYSKHAVFLALQTHSVGRPKSFLKITGHAIKPIFVTLNSLSVLFLRAEVLLSAKCNNMVCIQLYNGHKGMRYRASVRSIKMTEYRSLSSFLAFFLSARVRFIWPARAVAKQTVLCTHFDRLVFDNTLRTLYITLDEAKAVSLFVLKHGGQFWKHLKFFVRLGLSKWKCRKLKERRTNTVEHVDWSKKCFFIDSRRATKNWSTESYSHDKGWSFHEFSAVIYKSFLPLLSNVQHILKYPGAFSMFIFVDHGFVYANC